MKNNETCQENISGKNWRQFDDSKMRGSVPLYALGQKSRNENYIATAITDWNLHHLPKFIIPLIQEVTNRVVLKSFELEISLC